MTCGRHTCLHHSIRAPIMNVVHTAFRGAHLPVLSTGTCWGLHVYIWGSGRDACQGAVWLRRLWREWEERGHSLSGSWPCVYPFTLTSLTLRVLSAK